MLRKSLTILAILALVAVVPAVAFAGNGNGVDGQPIRAQLQVDPGTCDGTCPGFGYGLEDGTEFAPGDRNGFDVDRFYRIDGGTASAGGAGIGLTIARAIARAHGGDIVASSEGVGTGSSFAVTIPLRN